MTQKITYLNHINVGVSPGHERRGHQDEVSELGGERGGNQYFENDRNPLEKLGIDGGLVFTTHRSSIGIFSQK